jgi:hypothetical protein
MTVAATAPTTTLAMAGSESPSVDRNNRWPVQGWSSSDESHHDLDEQFVAEESARAFTVDKETRWPLQGWCKAHKPYSSTEDESAISSHLSAAPSRWPQGW